MADTVLDEAPKSVRMHNWLIMLRNEPELLETLQNSDDTAGELAGDEMAQRVINAGLI